MKVNQVIRDLKPVAVIECYSLFDEMEGLNEFEIGYFDINTEDGNTNLFNNVVVAQMFYLMKQKHIVKENIDHSIFKETYTYFKDRSPMVRNQKIDDGFKIYKFRVVVYNEDHWKRNTKIDLTPKEQELIKIEANFISGHLTTAQYKTKIDDLDNLYDTNGDKIE